MKCILCNQEIIADKKEKNSVIFMKYPAHKKCYESYDTADDDETPKNKVKRRN